MHQLLENLKAEDIPKIYEETGHKPGHNFGHKDSDYACVGSVLACKALGINRCPRSGSEPDVNSLRPSSFIAQALGLPDNDYGFSQRGSAAAWAIANAWDNPTQFTDSDIPYLREIAKASIMMFGKE